MDLILAMPSPCAMVSNAARVKFAGPEDPVQCSAYFRSLRAPLKIQVSRQDKAQVKNLSAAYS